MKILKIFGIVVGIHLFALILIFANPGCSTTKPAPAPGDTASSSNASPILAAPSPATSGSAAPGESISDSSAISFHPDTPAAAAPVAIDPGIRFSPTRPGTPVVGALMTEPVADVTPATSYTVKSGDNLWTIARKNNITIAQLTSANSISQNASLKPGQKLIIPGKGSASSGSTPAVPIAKSTSTSTSTSRAGSDVVKHVVKSGETLGAIARKYEVRQGELAVANNISDPAKIRPGMELVIPGWKAPVSKTSKTTKSTNVTPSAPPPSAPATFEPLPAPVLPSTPPPVPVIQIDENPAPRQP